ncbi:MAG: DHA2 family efflux MFS transporter permease subunit [Capsulimonadaceae bacterium]|nr:DHA2 family efflux MFS transporter permease subunit [Capsulimonadaceae bacterium]
MLESSEARAIETQLDFPNSAGNIAIDANKKYRWLILIGLVVSAVLEVMDTSILNVALPQMAGTLAVTTTDVAWVSTAYLLANVVFLPMTAWLGQRFGRKNYLVACVAIFAVARLMCAFSPSLAMVCFWRLLQGAAGAALISTSQAVLVEIFPAEQQTVVQALFGLGLVVAPAVAPLLGGWITDNYSWQTIFYIHVPVALLSLYLIGALYGDVSTKESRAAAGKIDIPGLALLAIGFGSLQYVLEEGQRYDWFGDLWITRLTIIAVIGIAAMIIWELWSSNKSPLVNLRIYGNRGLWSAVMISFVAGVGIYGINYVFALFVQAGLHFTSIKSGEALVPMGLGGMLSLVVMAVVGNRLDARIQIVLSLVSATAGCWMLGFNTQNTDLGDTWLPLTLIGFGIGGIIMPVAVAAFAALKPSECADGSAQLGLGRQLGGSFGIALLNTYISHMNDVHRSTIVRHLSTANQLFMHDAYGIAGILSQHGFHGPLAKSAALGIISQMVTLQCMLKAYNSGFQLMAIIFAACLPLVALLKGPKPGGSAGTPVTH